MGYSVHIAYYDFWKGIAISMVVAIHTATFQTDISFDSLNLYENMRVIFRLLINSAVPIFLAISGYFLSRKNLVNLKDCNCFWNKQITKVYVPMLFWSIPIFVFQIVYCDADFIKSSLLLFSGGYSIYYFIIVIIQCYILLPLIKKYKPFFLYISVVCILLSWGIVLYILSPLPLILYAGFFVSWLYYFVLGVILSDTRNNYSLFFVGLLILAGLILQYWETEHLLTWERVSLGQKVSSVVSNTGVILLMFSNRVKDAYKSNVISRFFELLGINSFGIYLIHCYFITFLSFFYEMKNWNIKCMIIIVLSLSFVVLVKNILPHSICNRFLGFR